MAVRAAQGLVNEQIKKLLETEVYQISQGEMELVNALHVAALWLVKPLHMKRLGFLDLQCFSSPDSALMAFCFKQEECEIMLEITKSFFGPVISVAFRGCDGCDSKMFGLEDRRVFEIFRDELLERIGFGD